MEPKSYYNPQSLYTLCIVNYVKHLKPRTSQLDEIDGLQTLPPNILADIYLAMSKSEGLRDILYNEMANLTIFMRMLKYAVARQKMIKCFSVLMCSGRQLSTEISSKFIMYTQHHFQPHYKTSPMKNSNHNLRMSRDMCLKQIENGMRLGTFLNESGWLQDSLKVLVTILNVINTLNMNYNSIIVKLDCLQRLLHTQVAFCCFTDANKSQTEANEIIDKIIKEYGIEKIPMNLLVTYYKVLSMLYFAKSDYNLSYDWSVKALELIGPNTPDKIVIDVLRAAAKACVVKREFDKARILILKAVKMSGVYFGESHQKYADTLLDYGFFLLNVDDIVRSVHAYTRALEIKRSIHGSKNLAVATAEEDLSYALYVLEYSSGNFHIARDHICKSIDSLRSLLPKDHLLLSSARRVKALILEEIALDNGDNTSEYQSLLNEAEQLHQSALKITIDAFGEVNVQTAKHYGNLGRLYQSMGKYQDAEELHKRAISIKSDLLGPYDYEVGLSIGHLASLYSYHMKKFREAEQLYLKSIAISLRLFGESYSGLEYDYKGLCNVYEHLNDTDKYLEYSQVLETWRMIREGNLEVSSSCNESKEDITLDEVREKFFDLCSQKNSVAVKESDNN